MSDSLWLFPLVMFLLGFSIGYSSGGHAEKDRTQKRPGSTENWTAQDSADWYKK